MPEKSNFKLLSSQLKSQKPSNKWLQLGFKERPGKSATEESYFPEDDSNERTPALTVIAVLCALLAMTLTSKVEFYFSLLIHIHLLLGYPTSLPVLLLFFFFICHYDKSPRCFSRFCPLFILSYCLGKCSK